MKLAVKMLRKSGLVLHDRNAQLVWAPAALSPLSW
jgi:hypothetical protein